MRRFVWVLILPVAACAMLASAPRPDAVSIGGSLLAVQFTNGETCTATLDPTGGTGTFAGCGGATYAVAITARNPLEPLLGAAVAPYADVTITSGDGVATAFRTPVSRDDD
jgi:hypothetical protein